ncbi:MAG: IS110 family transposase [Ignavibacteria bacterium]|nr:IS110 family transposase [Ignavibacteria bacterium]
MRNGAQDTQLTNQENMIYMGIDVHKRHINVAVMSEHVVLGQNHVEIRDVDAYMVRLKKKYPDRRLRAAYEAGFSGFALYHQLESLGIETIVVNAADVPTTDKERTTKSDRADSLKICHALKCGQLRKIWVPPDELSGDRDLVRYRLVLRQHLAKTKTRIKMFLYKQGVQIPPELESSHWTKAFQAWLKEQTMTTASSQTTLMLMLEELQHADQVYKKHLRRINELALTQRYSHNVDLLYTIPGIGRLTAITILTELGPIARFAKADQLASYVGLIPMQHQSGSSDRNMPIQRRAHQELRTLLVQCSWMAIKGSNHFNMVYEHKRKNKTSQVAIIAVARRLLNTIYAVLKKSQPFMESGTN